MANPYQAYGPNTSFLPLPAPHPSKSYDRHVAKNLDVEKDVDALISMREDLTRTPSPTPEEAAELSKTSMFDWKAMRSWRYWIRKEWCWYYLITVLMLVFTVLFVVYHKAIVDWLHPAAKWMHDTPAGWLIPIVVFIIVSFPPLFGHEILGILCGLVWGLGVGFAIVAAGTFLGEMANFYAFRHCCTTRGEKYEKKSFRYAYLVRVIRDGGFKIALIVRFSAIPPHFATAVFSTCGMNVWVFAAAAFLSLPKQFMTVYLGVALEQSQSDNTSSTDKVVKTIVIGVTLIVTILAMWWINKKMNDVKPIVIYERRKARQAKLNTSRDSNAYLKGPSLEANGDSAPSLNLSAHMGTIPLGSRRSTSPEYQRRDSEGKAMSFAPDPALFAPQPKRPARMATSQAGSRTDVPAQSGHPYGAYTPSAPQNVPPYIPPPGLIAKPPATKQPCQSTVSHQVPWSQPEHRA